jgi:alpha/beta superfamily hydrolase
MNRNRGKEGDGNGADERTDGDAGEDGEKRIETVLVPGARDARGTLDRAAEPAPGEREAVVIACPPHPQHGGTRADSRLGAVSAALGERGVSCLRFDYGFWDEGDGERLDTRNALRWASERYESVGLFGYSFGATMALCAAGEIDDAPEAPRAVSVLAPDRGGSRTDYAGDAVAALDGIDRPAQVCYGERDTTADWGPVVERARKRGVAVEAIPADHFFVGQVQKVATTVASFLAEEVR